MRSTRHRGRSSTEHGSDLDAATLLLAGGEYSRPDDVPDLHWNFAYNLFRLTGIVQGVTKRLQDSNASSAQAKETVARLMPLAEAAWAQARLAGA